MAKGVFTHAQSSCHTAKVVLEPRQDSCQIPIASDAPPRHTSRGFLVWALSRRRFDRSAHLFSLVSFFVRSENPFLRPDPRFACAGARRNCQGWPSHQPFPTSSAVARPHLDSFEHDGTLGAIGMTIRGEPAFERGSVPRHNLVFGGSKDPNHDAVMRIGSEAPKRRTHSSIRHESQGTSRDSATSNRYRRRATSVRTRPKLSGYLQRPPVIGPHAKRRRPGQCPPARAAT